MVATSAALTLSGVPFMGPIGGARVGIHQWWLCAQPDDRRVEGIATRPCGGRHRRSRTDGGIGSAGAFRGYHAWCGNVRSPAVPAGYRRDHFALAERVRQDRLAIMSWRIIPTCLHKVAGNCRSRPEFAAYSIVNKTERHDAVGEARTKVMDALVSDDGEDGPSQQVHRPACSRN